MKASSANKNLTKPLIIAILILASAMVLTSTSLRHTAADEEGSSGGTVTATPATFSNYELAGNQWTSPFSVGTTCPNSAGTCFNTQAEPAIRADRAGNFYASSESVYCVIGGLCGGTYAYKSTDSGSHFTTLPLPNSATAGPTGGSPAGSDTDIAVAPQRNTNGFFNVYVASLHRTLASIYVSTSSDGGASWSLTPIAANIPGDDRPWIAADGVQKVCISYHAEATTNDILIQCSTNAGSTFGPPVSTIDPANAFFLAGFNNQIGNLAIDPSNHVIYQVFSATKDTADAVACGISCHTHTVWIAVSINGGSVFSNHIVYNNPIVTVDYGHQFVNVAVDRAGNVYAVYTDDHNLFYSFSRDFGNSWSGPYQINAAPSNTAIFPWASAGSAGALDVVWYGTDYFSSVGPTNYPSGVTGPAWYVYFAQNLQATTPGSTFTQVKVSGIIHHGDVCEAGANCSSSQNRDLLDDFGVATSPTTGLAAIIYTSDQFVGSAAEPGHPHVCTSSSASNTVGCSHSDIAVQIGGTGVNERKHHHHFEVEEEDFEETDISHPGNHSPDFNLQILNTGTIAITSISVQIQGLPVTFTWTNFPLQAGQTAIGTTTMTPLGLVLAVGNVYPVTITVILSDGTTETQSTYAIYTLGAGLGL